MSDERYSPSVKVDHALIFIHITSSLQNGHVAEAWAAFQSNLIAMGNFGGALDAQLPKPTVVPLAPPLAAFETRTIAGGLPGTVYSVQAGADRPFSVEVSGSPFVTFSVGSQGVFDPARTTAGAGTGTPQPARAGEWCNWKYDAASGGQTMRPQL